MSIARFYRHLLRQHNLNCLIKYGPLNAWLGCFRIAGLKSYQDIVKKRSSSKPLIARFVTLDFFPPRIIGLVLTSVKPNFQDFRREK